jgi:pyruvate/2-oxoglutarate/acetoin dehydrogenase E1 component
MSFGDAFHGKSPVIRRHAIRFWCINMLEIMQGLARRVFQSGQQQLLAFDMRTRLGRCEGHN